jgi:hypothetical protein
MGTHYDLDEYMKHDWSSAGDVKYHLGRILCVQL